MSSLRCGVTCSGYLERRGRGGNTAARPSLPVGGEGASRDSRRLDRV